MAWNMNDYIAAALITIIVAAGIIVALYMLGVFNPQVNTVFPFK